MFYPCGFSSNFDKMRMGYRFACLKFFFETHLYTVYYCMSLYVVLCTHYTNKICLNQVGASPREREKDNMCGSRGRAKNHKAAKPAFHVGSSSARQRNAISMPFQRRFAGGPIAQIKAILGSSIPHQLKNLSNLDPSDRTFWIRAWTKRPRPQPK